MKSILLSVLLYSTYGFSQSVIPSIKIDAINKSKPNEIRRYCGSPNFSARPRPLFILNGFVIADSVFKKIGPSQIKSIEVLKDTTATERFGTKGKNGVIIITAKQELLDDLIKQRLIKPIL